MQAAEALIMKHTESMTGTYVAYRNTWLRDFSIKTLSLGFLLGFFYSCAQVQDPALSIVANQENHIQVVYGLTKLQAALDSKSISYDLVHKLDQARGVSNPAHD